MTGTDGVFDVLLGDGTIQAVGRELQVPLDAEVLQCSGKWLIPGLVDMHVHLRQPGYEDAETVETGLRAALAGGVTTVGVMPNTDPPMDSPEEVERLLSLADRAAAARAVPVPCVTVGRRGTELADLRGMASAGARCFSDDGDPVHDSRLLLEALDIVAEFDGAVIEHPEDKSLSGGAVNLGAVSRELGMEGIAPLSETLDVARCMEIAAHSKGRLHLTHLSLPRSIELARSGVFGGTRVTVDVTPHHLVLDENAVRLHGSMAKMNPPLRGMEDRLRLVEIVRDGMVDAVASDHAPHTRHRKRVPLEDAAFGITGIETLLPLTLEILTDAGMAPVDVLGLLSTGPASILGLELQGITEGAAADCVLFDPMEEYTLRDRGSLSRSSNSPFLERPLRGRVKAVWLGGTVYGEDDLVV